MNRIEKAYSLGYRATIDGKLYLNDKELPLYIRKKKFRKKFIILLGSRNKWSAILI